MDLFIVFIFGLLIGSFLNVCILRLPEGESIVAPRSRCPHCSHQLPWWANVPVLSYLALRGRCAFCSAPISPRYMLVELLTAGLLTAVYWRFGIGAQGAIAAAFDTSWDEDALVEHVRHRTWDNVARENIGEIEMLLHGSMSSVSDMAKNKRTSRV